MNQRTIICSYSANYPKLLLNPTQHLFQHCFPAFARLPENHSELAGYPIPMKIGIQPPNTPTSFARTHKDEAISSRTLRITASFFLYIYSGIMPIALGLFWHLHFRLPRPLVGFWKGLAKKVVFILDILIGLTHRF